MKEENEEVEVTGCAGSCHSCAGCSHDHETEEEIDSVLTLVDEDGKDVKFEILDVIVLENEKQYLVVVEADKSEDEAEAVILEIKEEDGEEVYDTVTDEAVANEVFETYMSQFEDEE